MRSWLLVVLVACGGGGEPRDPSDPPDPTAPTEPTDPPEPTDPTDPTTEATYLVALGISGRPYFASASFTTLDAFPTTTTSSGTFPEPGGCTLEPLDTTTSSTSTPSTSSTPTSSTSTTPLGGRALDPGDVTLLLDGVAVPSDCPVPGVCYAGLPDWPAGAVLGVRATGSPEFPPVVAQAVASVPGEMDADAAWLPDGSLEVTPLLDDPAPGLVYLVAFGFGGVATCVSDGGAPMVLPTADLDVLGRLISLQVIGLESVTATVGDVVVGATFFPSVSVRPGPAP